MNSPKMSDQALEQWISVLLRAGVLISGAVVLAGGIAFLVRHGGERPDYGVFHGQPSIDRIVPQIVQGAVAFRARSLIQFGVLLMIATPVMRVALSLVGFAMERDRKYVVITTIVLAVLLYSLISGAIVG